MIELVKKYKKAVTLAIGDGANDVSMIKSILKSIKRFVCLMFKAPRNESLNVFLPDCVEEW